jgi:hypothetical protein
LKKAAKDAVQLAGEVVGFVDSLLAAQSTKGEGDLDEG